MLCHRITRIIYTICIISSVMSLYCYGADDSWYYTPGIAITKFVSKESFEAMLEISNPMTSEEEPLNDP